ncbi:MAG TPA: adenylate/guanylate cyclase domain-containing protein [Dongiaceae bacterium]|nr:adenylate/guanylate cyclase domain-containing protein [Dongiaceae bacterium]
MRIHHWLVAALVALAISAGLRGGAGQVDGLSLDLLFWLRQQAFGARVDSATSPVAVIAIDEETYRQPPFKDLPNVLWTPQIARVLDATLAGGAAVVAFDIIYPTAVEKYLPGFDRDLRVALHDAAADGKVVLTKVQHRHKPISPFPGYSYAVGNEKNIRSANLDEDEDGIIRRVPLFFRSDDLTQGQRTDPSLALEVAARLLGASPVRDSTGQVSLAGYPVPAELRRGFLVNFDGGRTIPTYSLADLFACIEAGRADYFRRNFAGRAVLIGAVLDVEDRKLTSKRFIAGADGTGLAERCALPVPPGFYDTAAVRDTIPGVYVHAQAVHDLVSRNVLVELSPTATLLVDLALILAAAAATMWGTAQRAGLALLAGGTLWTGTTTAALQAGVVLPLLAPLLGAATVYAWLLGYRFAIVDKDKRQLRQAFGYYLPASVIDRMVVGNRRPALGGEERTLTVWFSDIEGFTRLAEGLSPPQLVDLLNTYFAAVTDIVEAHGGFVDKYVGDGVVAVFGAPVDDPAHARHAVEAAVACQAKLAQLRNDGGLPPGLRLSVRIGINTGTMLVGNIGSRRRFNYTVMGDAVNLASRLEGANKTYGTAILASEATVAACADAFAWREIDRVRVVGRAAPVRIFEPLQAMAAEPPLRETIAHDFAAALSELRAGRFAAAAAAFEALATRDAVSARMVRRAAVLAKEVPSGAWDGVAVLEQK